MALGTGLTLTTLGAILAFAVQDRLDGVDLVAVGWILMVVGVVAILLSVVFWNSWGGFGGRRTTVVERDRTLL
jgi:hypothetical protein